MHKRIKHKCAGFWRTLIPHSNLNSFHPFIPLFVYFGESSSSSVVFSCDKKYSTLVYCYFEICPVLVSWYTKVPHIPRYQHGIPVYNYVRDLNLFSLAQTGIISYLYIVTLSPHAVWPDLPRPPRLFGAARKRRAARRLATPLRGAGEGTSLSGASRGTYQGAVEWPCGCRAMSREGHARPKLARVLS